jgi:hypothetical protein
VTDTEETSKSDPLALKEPPTEEEQAATDLAEELARCQKRLPWPPWLSLKSVVGALTALGFSAYVCLYAYSFAFLGKFGTTPEEVGLTQPAFVVRAAAFGGIGIGVGLLVATAAAVILVLALGAAMFFLFLVYLLLATVLGTIIATIANIAEALPKRTRAGPGFVDALKAGFRARVAKFFFRWPIYWVRIKTAGLVAFGLVTVVPIGAYALHTDSNQYGAWVYALTLSGLFVFTLTAWARHFIAVGVIAVALFACLVGGSFRLGSNVATGYQHHSQKIHPRFGWTGLQADDVTIEWIVKPAPTDVPKSLVLLGHSDGVFLLSTSDGKHLYRVRDNEIVIIRAN